jgi:hypothetical protein
MDRIIELPDSVYEALQAVAAKSGTDPAGWITAQLAEEEPKPESAPVIAPEESPKTLYDLFKPHIGKFRSDGTKVLSENCGEQFTEYLLEKRRKGHL